MCNHIIYLNKGVFDIYEHKSIKYLILIVRLDLTNDSFICQIRSTNVDYQH